MLTLAEFLKLAEARRTVNEAVGEALYGLAGPLGAGLYGGHQLAYDVTALVPGIDPIQFTEGYLDGGVPDPVAGRQGCLSIVTAMREQAIRRRMPNRVAVKFGLADETPHVGNALIWLSEPSAAPADEIALAVCCAGLFDRHNERYAELIAAMAKSTLLVRLDEVNMSLSESEGDSAVVDVFRP